MQTIICDIETNSLTPTKIWCIVYKNKNKIFKWYSHEGFNRSNIPEGFLEFASTVDKWVFHNGICYDAPILNRLLGTTIRLTNIIDTLVLSRLANPSRKGGHSLANWGKLLAFPKGDYSDDWSKYTEEMLSYCIQDVELTAKVLDVLMKELKEFSKDSIQMEYKIAYILNKQKEKGFLFDITKATGLLNTITNKIDNLVIGT